MNAQKSLENQLQRAKDELSDLVARTDRLRIKIEVIEEAIRETSDDDGDHDDAETDDDKEGAALPEGWERVPTQPALKPTEAILEYLKRNGTSERVKITTALKDNILSNSTDKPHILRTCLHQLVERGLVIQEGDRYSLAG